MEEAFRIMFESIYKNKTVLITGHTGFKGSWLCIWLKELGANVIGYALEPYTKRDNFIVTGLKDKITHIIGDIRNYKKLREVFSKYQPEFVFHLAAQAIVRESYTNPKETYDVNIGGTVNVLECCRLFDSVKIIINITSDKCYENREWIWGYRENDTLGGYDPYSSSKGCSELVTSAYRNSFFNHNDSDKHHKSISTVRAGNVIGGGDWQKDRIVPDCIRALENNKLIQLRNPNAIRPWQHVLEPISGYLLLAAKMLREPKKFCNAWNFGPNYDSIFTVREIVEMIINEWGCGKWINNSNEKESHEARLLALDINKARTLLKWQPTIGIKECINITVEWYKEFFKNQNMYDVCLKQIQKFISKQNNIKNLS